MKIMWFLSLGTSRTKFNLLFSRVAFSLFAYASLVIIVISDGYGQSQFFDLTYSGRLTESDGSPKAGPVDLKINFYRSGSDSSPVLPTKEYFEVPLTDGIFQLTIALAPSEAAVVFNSQDEAWIEVMLGDKAFPRQRYMSVPFALRLPVNPEVFDFTDEGLLTLSASQMSKDDENVKLNKDGNISLSSSVELKRPDYTGGKFHIQHNGPLNFKFLDVDGSGSKFELNLFKIEKSGNLVLSGPEPEIKGVNKLHSNQVVLKSKVDGGQSDKSVVLKAPDNMGQSIEYTFPSTLNGGSKYMKISPEGTMSWEGLAAADITGTIPAAQIDDTIARDSEIAAAYQVIDANLDDLIDGSLSGSKIGPGIDGTNITTGTIPETVIAASIARDSEVAALYQPLDADLTDLADGSLTGSKVGTGIDGGNITIGTVADARIAATIARDSEVSAALSAYQPLDDDLTDLADGSLSGSKVGPGIDGGNITTGTVADARIAASLARDSEVSAALAGYQPLDDDLTDLSDGSLSGSKVGAGIDGGNITLGTIADERIASTIARDSEVTASLSGYQPLDADLTDLADGILSGSKVGTGINASNITSGVLADALIADSIARDSEVAAGYQAINADLTDLVNDLADGTISGTRIGAGIDGGNITSGIVADAVIASTIARDSEVTATLAGYQPLDDDLTDLADGSLSGSKIGTGIDGGNITIGTVADARIAASIARDSEVSASLAGYQPLDADLTDLADGSLTGSKVGPGISGSNISSGTVGDAYIAASIARDAEVAAAYQPLDADLTDLADGSLSGSKVGTGINGSNITSGTVGDAYIAASIARDAEVAAAYQPLDADLTDLADGSLSGSKVGAGINGANINAGTVTGTTISDNSLTTSDLGTDSVAYDELAAGAAKVPFQSHMFLSNGSMVNADVVFEVGNTINYVVAAVDLYITNILWSGNQASVWNADIIDSSGTCLGSTYYWYGVGVGTMGSRAASNCNSYTATYIIIPAGTVYGVRAQCSTAWPGCDANVKGAIYLRGYVYNFK